MIGRLTGVLVDEDADGDIVLDVNGVGYELTVPLGTLGRVRGAGGAEVGRVTLFVHTHVREEALVLYGFSSADERRAFRTLLGVSSIGPRLAISILTLLPAAELAKAVQGRDARALVAVPGVGKKSAERILLELRDKLTFVSATAGATAAGPAPAGPVGQQVVEGLARMGFKPSEAERAVSSLGKSVEDRPISEVFREALALLRH
jgi:holliday junction DNA helicase RuvA